MDTNQLLVTIDLEDYDAGLTGKLSVDGFSGFGQGWFNLSDIEDFNKSLENLALNLEGTADLIAGRSKADGSEYLEGFGLRCYVVAKTGIIGVHVTLSENPYTDCRKEEILKVSGELKAEVQSVLNFCTQLRKQCSGITREAKLVGR